MNMYIYIYIYMTVLFYVLYKRSVMYVFTV